jgi:hypothetical protein
MDGMDLERRALGSKAHNHYAKFSLFYVYETRAAHIANLDHKISVLCILNAYELPSKASFVGTNLI